MPLYAIAIDLGTTTLAASLLDLMTGERLASAGSLNPQRVYGADVVSRLDAACRSGDALAAMSSLIRVELRRLALEVCARAGVAWSGVSQVAIAGNPAMQHLLLGLPVRSLAFPPYRPFSSDGKRITAADLGWEGTAPVYVFPMPGGFVGGDTVAFVYAFSAPGSQVPGPRSLFLDLGTNGEMALAAGENVWATSAAAGPAFEGGNLSCGMAALPGAISSVQIEDDRLRLEVLGGGTPAGICGSAAIETVAGLLRHNVIEPGGRLRAAGELSSNLANRVIEHNGETAFVLYRDASRLLLLTQGDIRQIQLAKGAIRAGMEVLFERSCIRCEALRDVILTGSFGAVVRPEWLKTVGIFDGSMVHISRFTPEGVLTGVERALTAGDGFAGVEELGRRFRVVPLSGTPLFEEMFLRYMDFPRC